MAFFAAHVDALTRLCQTAIDENHRISLNKTLKKVKDNKPQFRQIEFKLKGSENAREVFTAG